jgi:hypothetical protein
MRGGRKKIDDAVVMALPFGTPDIRNFDIRFDPIKVLVLGSIRPSLMSKSALDPVFAVTCIQNKYAVGVLGREIRKKLVPLKK